MDVRLAHAHDVPKIFERLPGIIEELSRERSTEVVWGEGTEGYYRGLFETVEAEEPQVVAAIALKAAKLVGISFAGPLVSPLDLTWGKTAASLGTWVHEHHRRRGLAGRLRDLLFVELARQGYVQVVGTVAVTNAAGIASARKDGFQPIAMLGVTPLGGGA